MIDVHPNKIHEKNIKTPLGLGYNEDIQSIYVST